MDIENLVSGTRLTIKVKAHAKNDDISLDGETLVIKIKALAKDNEANEAVVKLLKKKYDIRCEIVRGHTSSIKQLKIL